MKDAMNKIAVKCIAMTIVNNIRQLQNFMLEHTYLAIVCITIE